MYICLPIQTSIFPFCDASWRGVKFQLSVVFGDAPASSSSRTTSACPKLQALCNGCKPPSSQAWIEAPFASSNSTTSRRPYPIQARVEEKKTNNDVKKKLRKTTEINFNVFQMSSFCLQRHQLICTNYSMQFFCFNQCCYWRCTRF